ncbi:MAG: hypothetical protein V1722_05455, partial [Candidatus Micrarchaeota archaeon]
EVKTIGKHTVYRHRKMVILIHAAAGAKSLEQVKKTLNKKRAFHAIQIVAYPHPAHLREFQEAQEGLRAAGPARDYPRSIGSIELDVHPERLIEIQHIQSHYSTSNARPLPRGLATRYAGWRVHALRHALQLAREFQRPLYIPKDVLYPRLMIYQKTVKKTQLHRDLLRVCKELGFKMKKVPDGDKEFIITSLK